MGSKERFFGGTGFEGVMDAMPDHSRSELLYDALAGFDQGFYDPLGAHSETLKYRAGARKLGFQESTRHFLHKAYPVLQTH